MSCQVCRLKSGKVGKALPVEKVLERGPADAIEGASPVLHSCKPCFTLLHILCYTPAIPCVTLLHLLCYTSASHVLHPCNPCVTLLHLLCYTPANLVLHSCKPCVTLLHILCYTSACHVLHSYISCITLMHPICVKLLLPDASWWCWCYFLEWMSDMQLIATTSQKGA